MKRLLVLLLTVLVASTSVLFLFSCNKEEEINYTNFEVNLFTTAEARDKTGAATTDFHGQPGDYLDVVFPTKTSFNTLVLMESTKAVKLFKLYYKNSSGEFTFLYSQDVIENYRYCSFPTVETDCLRIEICETFDDEEWELKDVEIYFMGRTYSEDFRVTAYGVVNNLYNAEAVVQDLSVVTKLILIGNICFDDKGNLYFRSENIGGKEIDGRTLFEASLKNVRAKLSPDAKIEVCILAKELSSFGGTISEMNLSAMTEHKETFIASINNFLSNYALDGISFDWEYPENIKIYHAFFNFMAELKERINGKAVTCALAPYDLSNPFSFNRTKLNKLDGVECMSYDLFDEHGYHASFYYSLYQHYERIKAMNGFERESTTLEMKKLDIGLPFYSRPLDRAAFWGTYNGVADTLGKFNNLMSGEKNGTTAVGDTYYNCYQMIYDKTAFCIDNGVGGVMIWHLSCDTEAGSELSLLGAIKSAIESRK